MLEFNNLTTGYSLSFGKKKSITSSLNFQIPKSSLVGIIGINGIGKSTLIKTLAGLINPLSGAISYENKSLEPITARERAKLISLVLTEKNFVENLTTEEFISLGRQPHTNWLGNLSSSDKKIIYETSERLKVEKLFSKSINTLSDGQLQKVLLTRAFVQDTPIVVLDEPTSHLDIHHSAALFNELKKSTLHNKKTIIFSSHNVNATLKICDYILILHQDNYFFDSPENLIKQQAFDTLFPLEFISFNKKEKAFTMHLNDD